MTRAFVPTLLAAVLSQQAPESPTFRAVTDLVRVDALVTRDGHPIAGLTAEAFEVRDNGVAQTVLSLTTIDAVHLGVALDVSGSMDGPRLAAVRRGFDTLLAELTPLDRYAAVAFGDQVVPIADSRMTRHEAAGRFARIEAGGSTALVDATYAAMLLSDPGPGPKLLLVMTDGRNNVSWLRAHDVIEAARRRETVIYPVAVNEPAPARTQGFRAGGGLPAEVGAGHPPDDSLKLLRLLARETGGRVVESEWGEDLGDVFRAILHEFRQRYVLAFRPEGVTRGDGWHTLDVRLRLGGGQVRARTKYWAGGSPGGTGHAADAPTSQDRRR